MMLFVDSDFGDPGTNLQGDMRLLDRCDRGELPGALRFWETCEAVVVAGHSNRNLEGIRLDRCRELGVGVLRRSTGGGTVVVGPGSLQYSVVLPVEPGGPLDGIRQTNTFVMERNRRALEAACRRPVRVEGYTDLVVGPENGTWRKVSGNSQRRARRAVLFHGTFLIDFDISLIVELLDNPRVAPEYRRGRGHGEFLANLNVTSAVLRESIRKEWSELSLIPGDLM